MKDVLHSTSKVMSDTVKKLYSIGDTATDNFDRKCPMDWRMLEAGVHFVEKLDALRAGRP